MSTLGMPVEHDFGECSADAFVEADVLREQVHLQAYSETVRMARLFLLNLADAKERWREAQFSHDYAGMDSAAAEQRDLTLLAAICLDHVRAYPDRRFNTASLTYGTVTCGDVE